MRRHKPIFFALDQNLVRRHKLIAGLVAGAHGLALLAALIASVASSSNQKALAASYTWDGGGLTNNWSDCDNWSTNICPVAGDSVIFDGTSTKDSTVDGGFNGAILNVNIASGYTGAVTLDRSLTTSGTFSQASGSTFNAGSNDLSVDSTFTLSATAIFNAGTGTVILAGSGGVNCGSHTFNHVEFQNTNTRTIASDCTLPLGTDPTLTHSVATSGLLSGSGILQASAGTITMQSTGTLVGFSGVEVNALNINGASFDASGYAPFDINNQFTVSSGSVFTAPAGDMNLGLGVTINSAATFSHNNGTIILDGSAGTIACGNKSFNLVIINASATTTTKTINSDCSLPLGDDPLVNNRIALSGSLSGTGTITVASNTTLNSGAQFAGFDGMVIGGSFTNAGATIDLSGYEPVDISTGFTLSSGSFTAPNGDMSVGGSFTISGGTFNHNSGTIILDSTTTTAMNCNNAVFNLVVLAHTAGIKTINSNCNLPLGDNPLANSGGDTTLTGGTLTGTGTLTIGGTLRINPGGMLSSFDGLTSSAITIGNGGDLDLSSYSAVNVNGAFVLQTGGTFTAPPDEAHFSTTLTINAGTTFNHSNGIIVFDGASGTITCNNAVFNMVQFDHTGTKTISNDCTFPVGNNPTLGTGGEIRLEGTFSGSGTINFALNTIRFRSNSSLVGFTGLTANEFIVENAQTLDLSSYAPVYINGDFGMSGLATFIAPSDEITIAGDITVNTGSTFTSSGGTVLLDGTDQTLIGDITFHNLTKIATVPAILTFNGGSTTVIEGALTLQGADENNLLSLVSSTPGSQWSIDAQGPRTLQYLSVQDSNNINTSAMLAYDSQDTGNNVHWQFLSSPLPPNPTSPGTNPNGELAETGEGRGLALLLGVLLCGGGVFALIGYRHNAKK